MTDEVEFTLSHIKTSNTDSQARDKMKLEMNNYDIPRSWAKIEFEIEQKQAWKHYSWHKIYKLLVRAKGGY